MKKPYLIINLILAGLVLLIFIYSAVFSAEKDNHLLPSMYEEITGKTSPSSGMSRAFSEIIRGNFDQAARYNPDGIPVFAFFLVQGILRLLVSLLLLRSVFRPGNLVIADAILSSALFLYCFSGQIIRVISQAV